MEYGLNKINKEYQGELRYLFTKLNSWQEESQRQFYNVINSQSINIDKSLSNLLEEVSDLQAQLSIITRDRDNLILTVDNLRGEITRLEVNPPYSGTKEIDCYEHEDQGEKEEEEEGEEEVSNYDEDLKDHVDHASEIAREPNTNCSNTEYDGIDVKCSQSASSSERVTDEPEVIDQPQKERLTAQFSKMGIPEKRSNLNDHIESVHNKVKKKLKCEHCPYTSATLSHMKEHIEVVHERVRVNSCGECGFTPSRKRDLKRHMKVVHTKRHICEDCGHAESRKPLLTSHRLVVHKIRD